MNQNFAKQTSRRGFSLIEVLVVITIIAGLVAMLATNVLNQRREADINMAEITIKLLVESLQKYKMRENRWPTQSEGLEALTQPSGRSRTPVLDRLENDPWGNPYLYQAPHRSSDTPLVYTLGADGQPGGEGVDADLYSDDRKSLVEE